MFKQLTAILLIAAFVAQTFSGGFVLINYYTNTAAFAKNCVNKAKPKLHCNGKCQMMKKLQEEEKKEQQMPERKMEKKMEIICSSSYSFNFASSTASATAVTIFGKNYSLQDIAYSFFHPPQA